MKNYFAKVSKTGILEALTEAKGDIAPAWNKAKKGDLAVIAERQLAETGWLPHCCARPPDALSPDGPCSCAPPFRRPGSTRPWRENAFTVSASSPEEPFGSCR